MKKRFSYAIAALVGLLYGLVTVLLSRLWIRCSGGVFWLIGTLSGLEDTDHITQVLRQLKTASIASPWVAVLLAGAALGALFYLLISRCKRKKAIACWVGIPLLLPVSLALVLFTKVNDIRPSAMFTPAPEAASYPVETYASQGERWYVGFGRQPILPDETSSEPLYIAGYNFGVEITGIRDYCEARAVWLDTGEQGILLIGIDCVGLDSGTVDTIRQNLTDLPNCASINVYATHTHAGIDTLGLWGPMAVDGKNDAYMENLILAATQAGRDAAAGRTPGKLRLGQIRTPDMFRDSRLPQVLDENLYQLRFVPDDGTAGTRMFFYGAHAEALRSANTLASRDYPGVLCDAVTAATGDHTMFFPGAIGGLIMTRDFVDPIADPEGNLAITSEKLVAFALAITEDMERELSPSLTWGSQRFVVPMDNTVFLICRYLGVLHNKAVRCNSATGYGVDTELALVKLDDLGVALLPGEIFPELVYGPLYGDANPTAVNPEALRTKAARSGCSQLLVVGLCNDEIGYIVPPSDFLVNEKLPYLERTTDYKGEDHYEETNSIGPKCADTIATAFQAVADALT